MAVAGRYVPETDKNMTVNGTGGSPPLAPSFPSSATLASAILPLAFLCTFFVAQPAAAQNPCTVAQGTVGAGGTFTANSTGIDYRISCSGTLVEDITDESLRTIYDAMTEYVKGRSKVVGDVRGDTSELYRISINSDAGSTIFTGTLTNSANNGNVNQKDNAVIQVSNWALRSGSTVYPIVVESHATVTARGDGRRGVAAYDDLGADSTATNYGVITTEGDIYTRPAGRNWRVRTTRGLVAGTVGGGDATAINETGATVTSRGLGGQGLNAGADGTGDALAVNKGTVTTTGGSYRSSLENFNRRPYGVNVHTGGGGSATARNEAGATITTGNPTLIANPGNATGLAVSGTQAVALSVGTESAAAGPVSATNAGTITTHGTDARGINTWIDSYKDRTAASSATAINSGTITTHGEDATGVRMNSPSGDNAGSRILLRNTGTITTNGGGSSQGIAASFYYNKDDTNSTVVNRNARGTITTENSGVITMRGDGPVGRSSIGVWSGYWAPEGSGILDSGDVVIKNTGTVNVSGEGANGLRALTHGTGNVDIDMTGGTVTAGTSGTGAARKFGIGIWGAARTDSTANDSSTDVDVDILVSGSATAVTAYGGASDHSFSALLDETIGLGIWAFSGTTSGHSKVVIRDGASVRAYDRNGRPGAAVLFEGGRGTLDITASRLYGDVIFAGESTDDVINVSKSGKIDGDVDFRSGGTDILNVSVDRNQTFEITGKVRNTHTLNKTGAGHLRIGGELKFSGSALNLDNGVLVVADHVDLGASGKATVKKEGRLVFEINSTTSHGSLTAGELLFDGTDADAASVYTQIGEDVADDQVDTLQTSLATSDLTLLNVSTINTGTSAAPVSTTKLSVQSADAAGTATTVGTLTLGSTGAGTASFDSQTTNKISKVVLPTGTPPTTGGTASSGSGGVLGLGLLAALIAFLSSDDEATAGFADYDFGKPRSAYVSADERGMLTVAESGDQPYRLWIRTGQSEQPTAHMTGGSEIGVTLYGSDRFHLSTSMMPNVTGSVHTQNLSAEGSAYALSGGWRNDRYFAGLRLSQGEYDGRSVIDNPVVNSALAGSHGFRNSQVKLTTGANFTAGNIRLTPSASFQAGRFEHDPHVAYSPVLEAKVPGYTQDYASLKLGVKVTSTDWLGFTGDSVWKPHLRFDTIRTDSQRINGLSLDQSDRLGVMDFSSSAGVRPMPEVINALGFGAKIKSSKSDRAEWKFGFAGFEADGEYHHATMVGYKIRF